MVENKAENDYVKGKREPLIHWEDLSIDIKYINEILEEYVNKNFLGKGE